MKKYGLKPGDFFDDISDCNFYRGVGPAGCRIRQRHQRHGTSCRGHAGFDALV